MTARHQLFNGGVTFDNTQSEELGRQQGQATSGNKFANKGLEKPSHYSAWQDRRIKGMKGTGRLTSPIKSRWIWPLSVPVGNNGLTTGLSYMESMTRPGADARDQAEANMKSATATVSYPLVYKRDKAVFFRGTLS